MAKITIDNKPLTVDDGTTVLEAARKLGISIPTLCHFDGMEPGVSCMVCVVKINGSQQLRPSCATVAVDGMVIDSDTEEVHAARRTALELLLSDHVGDCIAPCQTACPAKLAVPQTIRRNTSPPDAVPCHNCDAPCERACRRSFIDKPVSIKLILQHLQQKAVPLEKKKHLKEFSVHMGKLSDAELKELAKQASSDDRVEPSDPVLGFTADETIREAKRCLHCDCRKPDACKLRTFAEEYGAKPASYKGIRRPLEVDWQHSLVVYEPGKCIACGICTRITARAEEAYGLAFTGRGFTVRVDVPFDQKLPVGLRQTSEQCAQACPTGAISMKD